MTVIFQERMQERLDFLVPPKEEKLSDKTEVQILKDLMCEIETRLKNADAQTQTDELIDTYLEVATKYNQLTGFVVPETGAVNPDQGAFDIVNPSNKVTN